MSEERIPVTWRPRSAPLEPAGLAARGEAARALARRLLKRDAAALARLQGVAAPGLLVVLGDAADLPWVDGAIYLGRDSGVPSLLLPTAREPAVPLPLLERALLAHGRAADAQPPFAVLVDPGAPPVLASLLAARPIDRPVLLAWLAGRPGGGGG